VRIIGRAGIAAALALACFASTTAQETAAVYQGEAAEEFLSKARIVRMQGLAEGVTGARKATLELNGVTRSAAFKTVDIFSPGLTKLANGQMEMDFTDTWRTEIAAYVVDRIIGLGFVPATVERSYDGKQGSMQWWLTYEMKEADRVKNKITPPDQAAWNQLQFKMLLFDNLIYNTDIHLNQILVTKDFDIRLHDHSRSFRSIPGLKPNHGLTRFSRSLLSGLEKLERQDLSKRIGKYISGGQINLLLRRRDDILALAKKLVAEKGEAAVLYP
jgi:hypothetical protein